MIDEAQTGSRFFRFVISPDPQGEDTRQDLQLRMVTEYTMQHLEDRLQQSVSWVGVVHADHAPHRHVHIVAVVKGKLNPQDFQALRQTATEACLQQRSERDLVREQERKKREEAQWGVGYYMLPVKQCGVAICLFRPASRSQIDLATVIPQIWGGSI